jgi:SH3-like domain-containing protein
MRGLASKNLPTPQLAGTTSSKSGSRPGLRGRRFATISAAWLCGMLAALVLVVLADLRAFAQSNATAGASGLPLPRYVSLKSDRVNLRQGPGTDYPTAWVYRRAGLPLEVIEEYEAWRKVRDSEGTTGWILSSLLSGRRTALVLPWELKADTPRPQVPLRRSNSTSARAVAMIEAGVIADIQSCDGQWCYVVIDAFRGYLEQGKLWGVYSRETLE